MNKFDSNENVLFINYLDAHHPILLYAYFFNHEIFHHIFQYEGPESPYINPSEG